MQGKVASFVGSVQLRLKIDEATSNKDDPTPIYLMDEVAQMVGSQSDAVNAGVDHIVRRLGNKAPTVKQKALRLVKHMCTRGSPEFRRQIAKHSAVIRELTSFRCEPDPFKGDIPWKRVQQLAQEALASLHGVPEPQATSSALMGRIQGFGSDVGAGSSSRPAMVGFGSDSIGSSGDRGGTSAYSGGLSRMVGFGSDSKPSSGGRYGGYGAISSADGGGRSSGQSFLGSISSGMRSLSGTFNRQQNSLLSEEGYGATNGSPASEPDYQAPSATYTSLAAGTLHGGVVLAGVSASSAASQEARAVDKICTPAGLRAAPDREDLQSFVEAVSNLDGNQVARLLQERMELGPWQATLRALCAIEAVIEGGSTAACGEIAVHFQANPDPIRSAAGSPQSSVRQRAGKVLQLIGDNTLPASGTSRKPTYATSAGAVSSAQATSLDDLLGEPSASAASVVGNVDFSADLLGDSTASEQPVADRSSVADFLGGLGPTPPGGSQQAQQGGGSALPEELFSGLSVASSGAAQGAGLHGATLYADAPISDLLGDVSSNAGTMMQQPPAHQQPQTLATGGGVDDLFGGLAVSAAMPATAAAGVSGKGDIFSGLSLGPSSGAGGAASVPAAVPVVGMGMSSRAAAGAAKPRQQSSNLDSLLSDLNLGPSTQQQPMKGAAGTAGQQAAFGGPSLQQLPLHGMGRTMAGGQQHGLPGQQMLLQQQQPGMGVGARLMQPGMLGQRPEMMIAGMVPPAQAQMFMMQQQQAAMMAQMQQMGLNPMQMRQLMLQQQQQFAMMQQQALMGATASGPTPFMMGMQQQPQMQPQGAMATAGGRCAIPLEEFHDTVSHQGSARHKKDSSFDFVGDHLQNLKRK